MDPHSPPPPPPVKQHISTINVHHPERPICGDYRDRPEGTIPFVTLNVGAVSLFFAGRTDLVLWLTSALAAASDLPDDVK